MAEHARFTVAGGDGAEQQPRSTVFVGVVELDDDAEWQEGSPLRHLSFDDPPHGKTPEEYKRLLVGAIVDSGSLTQFAVLLGGTLARDLILSHGVPPAVACEAVAVFAQTLYEQYHDAE